MKPDALEVVIPGARPGIHSLKMKNPVIAASGTFGFGREYAEYINLNELGGIAVKGLTLSGSQGNPPPRIIETPMGMINSIGLQNPGIQGFIESELPFLTQWETAVIVNISGNTVEEFVEMADILEKVEGIHGIEVNVSCPNIHRGGEVFATNPDLVEKITASIRRVTRYPVIVKLSPNVTDIATIAARAESGGADAVSLINTLLGMAIDIDRQRPMLVKEFGGLSGPAVKPVALRQVWQVYQAVTIPVIGMGGIMSGEDAIEFLLAGASAVSVGTANFVDPRVCLSVAEEIQVYMKQHGHRHVSELVGAAHRGLKQDPNRKGESS